MVIYKELVAFRTWETIHRQNTQVFIGYTGETMYYKDNKFSILLNHLFIKDTNSMEELKSTVNFYMCPMKECSIRLINENRCETNQWVPIANVEKCASRTTSTESVEHRNE